MEISERLKMIRGIEKQEDFAKSLLVNKNTVGRWERGDQTPNAEDLNKILEVYPDINPTWLLTGKGEIKRGEAGSASVDAELLEVIITAVEEVSNEIGREETIFPISERSRIAVDLYRLFSKEDVRQYVTLDNMKDQVVNMFFLTSAYEKIDTYKKKLNLNPADKKLKEIDWFVRMRKLHEDSETKE